MQKQTTKRNIILILLITALFAVAALFVVFNTSRSSTASAEGNAAIPPLGAAAEVSPLVLDVNGKYATSISGANDDDFDKLEEQNGKGYGERWITNGFVIQAYNTLHGENLDLSSWYFVKGGITTGYNDSIYLDSSKFDVKISDDTSAIIVTAKGATNPDVYEHFSVKLCKRRNFGTGAYYEDTITVYFNVRVNNTFLQFGVLDTQKEGSSILVGKDLTNQTGAETDASKKPIHEPIKVFDNNTKITIRLSEVLKDHILYRYGDDGNYVTPITQDGTNGSKVWWGIRSVNNFVIREIQFMGLSNIIMTDETAPSADPTLSAQLNLTSTIIGPYASQVNAALTSDSERMKWFWSDETVHTITLKLGLRGNTGVSYTILIPVQFRPANPQRLGVDESTFSLNVLSPYTYNLKDNVLYDQDGKVTTDSNGEGYKSIIVRPTDLIEYSAPDEYAKKYGERNVLTFDASGTTGFGVGVQAPNVAASWYENEFYRIEKVMDKNEEGNPYKDLNNSFPDAYKITAKDNAIINITLGVRYFTFDGGSKEPIQVSVPINSYGNYRIIIPDVNNKLGVSYNVLSSNVFGELLEAGFQMSHAESLNTDQLSVSLSDNMLTLTPLVDQIDGQTTARILMEFTNSASQRVTITSEIFAINVKAKDFFSLFDADWKAWLVIAAIILGGILIILLVVWLFIHSISKHKQDEASTQAPVSSYIVKLNATIAATQAQQRLAASTTMAQANSAAAGQMLLSSTATNPTDIPNTLQLAAAKEEDTTTKIPKTDSIPSEPRMSEPKETVKAEDDVYAKIAEYITDDELLERIFTEKYEPKGMVRRTFFKSKDLQARELEKEKKRIIERYNTPMPMVEAIMSEAQIMNGEVPMLDNKAVEEQPEVVAEIYVLNFDPDSPLYTPEAKDEFSEEKIEIDLAPEEVRLRDLEEKYNIILAELKEISARLENAQGEYNKVVSHEDELRANIAKAEEDRDGFKKAVEDLEFQLASAKQKDKDRITRDIKINEEKIERATTDINKWKDELDRYQGGDNTLSEILAKLNALQAQKTSEQEGLVPNIDKARADYEAYLARLEQVKKRQEIEAKVEELTPMLVAVNTADHDIKHLQIDLDKINNERESVKADVTAAKAQILGANDFDLINELNLRISDGNARLSEIDKEFTKATKQNSELNIEFNSQRRKANEFVETNDIPLEDVIRAEDKVIGDIEFNDYKLISEKDRDEAEQAVAHAQAVLDDVTTSSGDVTLLAMEIAAGIKDLEDELENTQAELDEINLRMETADDDERLMLMVDQGDKADKVEELKAKVKQANIDGTKRKTEIQAEYDEKLEVARRDLDAASEEFQKASDKFDSLINNTNPLDLIVSGSGIISQDQKKREEENLKKQLERSKNEIEQARLAAQQAQEEAERAKEEAARKAQEAIDQAEAARLEAEEKARQDAEAAEQAIRDAEEAAEQAKREAEEAAEQARREAEEAAEQAKREAEEAAEQARREAEEATEQARREAEEAAEQARREAEEAVEQARLEGEEAGRSMVKEEVEKARVDSEEDVQSNVVSEEEAERMRRETEEAMLAEIEEAKRRAQEEIDEMRRKNEEEEERRRLEEEARLKEEEERKKEEEERKKEEEERLKAEEEHREAIAKKIAARKEQIVALRNKMPELKGTDDAKLLREQLYNQQLTYDEDERGSTELMDFYNKTMDDIENAGEIARLKAENAKKPKRVVRKVTERVTRRPKKKKKGSGARRPAGSRSGSRSASGRPRSASSRQGARPAGSRPRPSGARPSGTRPPTRRS